MKKIIYHLKEKPVFSEADALFFEEIENYGEIINQHFGDFIGISVGCLF